MIAALVDLDDRIRAMDALRKALEARDSTAAERAYASLPSWAWPASVARALASLRPTAAPAPDRDWHPDGFGAASRGVR